MPKPDYERAQIMIRDVLKQAVKECGFTDQVFEFGVVLSACHAAVMTELVPSSKLMEPGGVESAAFTFSDTLNTILLDMLKERAAVERREARH